MIDSTVKAIAVSKQMNGQLEEYEKWNTRVKSYNDWKQKHNVLDHKAGDKVDVRDTEYIWCSGVIELKISSMDHNPLFYVHYEVSYLHSNCYF